MNKGPAQNCNDCKGKPKKVEAFGEDSTFIGKFCSKCLKTVEWENKIEDKKAVLFDEETIAKLEEEANKKEVKVKKRRSDSTEQTSLF